MAQLSQIASVVIELSTASIAKASFGIPMVVGASTASIWGTGYTRIYTDVAAAVVDNLEPTFIKALQEAFSQTPRIERVMVGRLIPKTASFQADPSGATSSTGNTQTYPTGTALSLTIDGTTVTYTTVANDTVLKGSQGLLAAANAISAITDKYTIAAGALPEVMVVTPKSATDPAPTIINVNNVVVTPGTINPTDVAAGLTKINSESNIWYGLCVMDRRKEMIMAVAEWTESAFPAKQYFTASGDPAIWTNATDDVLSQLMAKQYLRTTLIAHKEADSEYPEAAWMGKVYTADPGSVIFGLKVLASITPSVFTPGEQQFIWGKNGNTYEQYAENTYLINKGKTVSGEWVDIIRDRDWLIDYIQKSIASAMIRRKKIPYTNQGIQIIVNVLQGCLRYAQQLGVLAPDETNTDGETVPGFIINYPNAADVSADIKASRELKISFVGLLAGAIQMTEVRGVLAYKYGE